jgi:hypothetical protein
LSSTGRTAIPVGPTIDNVAGCVTFGAFTFGSQAGVTGAGDLATVRFQALAPGQMSVTLSEMQLGDPQGAAQPVGERTGAAVIVNQAVYLPLIRKR